MEKEEIDNLKKELADVLKTLSEKEEKVIQERYGLYDIPKSRKQVADSLGLSVSGVRQIEIRAIKKLRHPIRHFDTKKLEIISKGE